AEEGSRREEGAGEEGRCEEGREEGDEEGGGQRAGREEGCRAQGGLSDGAAARAHAPGAGPRRLRMEPRPVTAAADAVGDVAAALRRGGVVAYPTEAVFGLGCDPRDRAAFDRLVALKLRPPARGVLLLGADFAQVAPWIDLAATPADALERARA